VIYEGNKIFVGTDWTHTSKLKLHSF
jgi:hypothetical protein